nr:MAG TPA: hypothetical protein [Caudoviricetes sp.]
MVWSSSGNTRKEFIKPGWQGCWPGYVTSYVNQQIVC